MLAERLLDEVGLALAAHRNDDVGVSETLVSCGDGVEILDVLYFEVFVDRFQKVLLE